MTPPAASRPYALPPVRQIAWIRSGELSGESKSVSRVPGAPPRTSTPATAPCSPNRTTVQPVSAPKSSSCPTVIPGTSTIVPLIALVADIPQEAEIPPRVCAKRDQRLRPDDPRKGSDVVAHHVAELLVLPNTHDGDDVVFARNAVRLGHRIDLEQLFCDPARRPRLGGDQDDRRNHLAYLHHARREDSRRVEPMRQKAEARKHVDDGLDQGRTVRFCKRHARVGGDHLKRDLGVLREQRCAFGVVTIRPSRRRPNRKRDAARRRSVVLDPVLIPDDAERLERALVVDGLVDPSQRD